MKDIYLLSGLGADKRVFDYVDLSGFKIHHVEWIDPVADEAIESYANRLLQQVRTVRPILIGVSFGGMIAVEIAKLIETEKVIIISSAKTRFELPYLLRFLGLTRLNKLVPASLLKIVNRFTFWFFGTKTKKDNTLLQEIIKATDVKFLKWAVDKILTWKNTTQLKNLIHIHGTADKIIPIKTVDFKIEGGGHLMILNKGNDVSILIRTILAES